MGRSVKLTSGNWRIQWFDSTGKRCSATFKTQDAARSALRRNETSVEDIRVGRARPLSDSTIAESAPLWLATRAPSASDTDPGRRERKRRRQADNKFVHRDGKPLKRATDLAGFTRRACVKAGIAPVHYHALWNTWASHAGDAGLPIARLQAILGHEHITTTQRYVHVSGDAAARDQRARLSFAAPAVAEVVELGQRVGS